MHQYYHALAILHTNGIHVHTKLSPAASFGAMLTTYNQVSTRLYSHIVCETFHIRHFRYGSPTTASSYIVYEGGQYNIAIFLSSCIPTCNHEE